MAKAKKATRKFGKNNLKDTLERRKGVAKIKQRHRLQDKKKAKRAKEGEEEETPNEGQNGVSNGRKSQFQDMDVDEFFQGGFEIPEASKTNKRGTKNSKRKRADEEEEEDDVEDSDVGGGDVDDAADEVFNPDESDSESGEDDIDAHKRELEGLAEKDPEFYKYLQENDAELLRAEGGNALVNIGQLSESEADPTEEKNEEDELDDAVDMTSDGEAAPSDGEVVTSKMLDKWRTNLTQLNSLRALKQVIFAFRTAAHINDTDEKAYKYSISSADVYHELLLLTLKHVPEVLQHHLPVKETPSGKIRLNAESKKYRDLTSVLKSHATSLHHLLTTLSDAATLKLTLTSIIPLLPYFLSFKKYLRGLIKSVVAIWSDPASTEATRVTAFLVLRRLVVIGDAGLRETSLKSVYQGLVKGSRNTNMHTLPGVNLMKNSAAELWVLDANVGYTTGFTFIRQLAIHLRSCITNPTKDSYKSVYNWQFIHSLDFWSRVLSMSCSTSTSNSTKTKESPLTPLIYPVVQITLGTTRLIPTAQYFPLRFQLIRSLLRLGSSTGTYIPLAPLLLEVLSSPELRKAPKASTLKPLDFGSAIRAPKSYLRTRIYQDNLGEEITELLAEFFVQWTKSIAFVELALPVIVSLKRWLKDVSNSRGRSGGSGTNGGNKNGKINASITLLIQKLETNSKFIGERRAKIDFAPNDRVAVEGFLKDVEWDVTPLGAFVKGARKRKEEQMKMVERGRRIEEERNMKGRKGEEKEKGRNDEDVEMDDDDEEEEEE
ncbi:MAG: hypothetical protein M1823_002853 [Watsoniomyces obsoletus]|nr:MAG: hypothetical protein M1823_002853 [Watsoniomyces obsoletus]